MNHSSYLDRQLLPLTVLLPRMLAQIEADFAAAGPAVAQRLRQGAELMRSLLAPIQPADHDQKLTCTPSGRG